MPECSGCGGCCNPVLVAWNPQERAAQRLTETSDPTVQRDYEFIAAHWHSEATYEKAGCTIHRVRCDSFDPVSKQCRTYDTRPAICSGFPWYGSHPEDPINEEIADQLVPQCPFNADVRTMLPIVEVR